MKGRQNSVVMMDDILTRLFVSSTQYRITCLFFVCMYLCLPLSTENNNNIAGCWQYMFVISEALKSCHPYIYDETNDQEYIPCEALKDKKRLVAFVVNDKT